MKVVFFTVGTSTPASVSKWAYSAAHHLRKHNYEAMVFPWFGVLHEHHIEKWADMYLEKGDIVIYTSEYAFHEYEFQAIRSAYAHAKRRGCTVAITERNYNHFKLKYDFDISGKFSEDKILDFVNTQTGRIKRIPFDLATCDFKWRKEDGFVDNTPLHIELSRHCIFDCSFCTYPNRGVKNAPYRDAKLVRAELDSAYELFGTKHHVIMCSTFNDNRPKLESFFEAIDGTEYEFAAFIRLELLMKQKDLWPKFKKHIRHMCFGIDTFNWETGKVIGKGMNPATVRQWMQEVRDYFDDCLLYSCVIAGMPNTPREEPQEWVDFLKSSRVLDGWHITPLGVMAEGDREFGSHFDKNLESYGYTRYPIVDYQGRLASGWVREDGYDYVQATEDTVRWNEFRDSTPAPFGSVMLRTQFSMEHIKSMRVGGRSTTLYTPEHIAMLDRIRLGFWKKAGVVDE